MRLPVTLGPSRERLPAPSLRTGRVRSRRGFTLVEVVLALGVFAILIVGCIGLLSLSSSTLRDVVTRDEAIHLTSALKQHLNQLSFDAAYKLVGNPNNPNPNDLYICSFRAQAQGTTNPDGTPLGYSGTARSAGEAYVVLPTVREAQDALLKSNDLPAREGRIFRVKLSLSASNPVITQLPVASADYHEAVLTIQAKFFPLNGSDPQGTNAQIPSQTCTLAVLR